MVTLMERVLLADCPDDLWKAFYNLCKAESEAINIKRLFLKLDFKSKVNGEILNGGLLGAVESNNHTYIPLIINFMEKNQIQPDSASLTQVLVATIKKDIPELKELITDYINKNNVILNFSVCQFTLVQALKDNQPHLVDTILNHMDIKDSNSPHNLLSLQYLFNYTSQTDNIALANRLDKKYSIIEKSLREKLTSDITLQSGSHFSFAELKSDGLLEISGGMGEQWSQEAIEYDFYATNPILFNLEHVNLELLDSFFKPLYPISEDVVTHALIKNIYLNNQQAISFLLNNEQCTDIVQNSEPLKAFIQEDTQWIDNKRDAKSILAMLNLEENLPQKSITTPKVKI